MARSHIIGLGDPDPVLPLLAKVAAGEPLGCRDLSLLGIGGAAHDLDHLDPHDDQSCECVRPDPRSAVREYGCLSYPGRLDEPGACRSATYITGEGLQIRLCCRCWELYPGKSWELLRDINEALAFFRNRALSRPAPFQRKESGTGQPCCDPSTSGSAEGVVSSPPVASACPDAQGSAGAGLAPECGRGQAVSPVEPVGSVVPSDPAGFSSPQGVAGRFLGTDDSGSGLPVTPAPGVAASSRPLGPLARDFFPSKEGASDGI